MSSIVVDPSNAVYEYTPHHQEFYSETVCWSPVSKKNSPGPHHPPLLYSPPQNISPTSLISSPSLNVEAPHSILVEDKEWTRSYNAHCPPPSATTSSFDSLVTAVEYSPVEQEYPEYSYHLLSQSWLSPVHSPCQSLYHSRQHAIAYPAQGSYNPSSGPPTTAAVSSTDSPLCSPFIPSDQYGGIRYAPNSPFGLIQYPYTSLSEYMGNYQPQAVHDTLTNGNRTHTSPHVVQEESERSDPRYDKDAKASELGGNGEFEVDKTPSSQKKAFASMGVPTSSLELAMSPAFGFYHPNHVHREAYTQDFHRVDEGEDEKDGEPNGESDEYNDPKDSEYNRHSENLVLDTLGTMDRITGADGMRQGGATSNISTAGRRRAATEFFGIVSSSELSAYDWNQLTPYNQIIQISHPDTPLRTTIEYPASATPYSPYPVHRSGYHDCSSRRTSPTYAMSSAMSSADPSLTPKIPLTPGTAMSPSATSGFPYPCWSSTTMGGTPLMGSLSSIGVGGKRRLHQSSSVPIPVPNLTKKSRGRRVPTVTAADSKVGPSIGNSALYRCGKRARIHTCKVPGCGKCFARSEHLKRHIRSIHTYDKPHKCPYPGCGKDFSRHDNLSQHMRVHKCMDHKTELLWEMPLSTHQTTYSTYSDRQKA